MLKIIKLAFALLLLAPLSVLADPATEAVSDIQSAASLYRTATQDYSAGRFSDAYKKFLEFAQISPNIAAQFHQAAPNIDVQLSLGCTLMSLGKYQEAVEYLERAVQNNPDKFDTQVSLGTDLQHLGRLQEAAVHLEKAVQINPNYLSTQEALCYVLMVLGQHRKAVSYLEKLVQSKPEDPKHMQDLGTELVSIGDLPTSLNVLQELISRFPTSSQAQYAKAVTDRIQKQIEKCKKVSNNTPEPDFFAETMDFWSKEPHVPQICPHWADNRMPLRVNIHDGKDIPGYKPEYDQVLRQSFNAWQEASHGLVRFSFVESEKDADINFYWTSDSEITTGSDADGEAVPQCENDWIVSGVIRLAPAKFSASDSDLNNKYWSITILRQLCLHEVGHIIGLIEHSTNPDDVMYFWCGIPATDQKPTKRDIATLVHIYNYSRPSKE